MYTNVSSLVYIVLYDRPHGDPQMIRFGAHLVLVLRFLLEDQLKDSFREKIMIVGDHILRMWVVLLCLFIICVVQIGKELCWQNLVVLEWRMGVSATHYNCCETLIWRNLTFDNLLRVPEVKLWYVIFICWTYKNTQITWLRCEMRLPFPECVPSNRNNGFPVWWVADLFN